MTDLSKSVTVAAGCPAHAAAGSSVPAVPVPGMVTLDGLHPVLPVHWRPERGMGYWSVTRYAEVDRVLRETATFTSERGTMLCLLGKDDPAAGRQMAATDPPRHRQLRDPLQRALNVKSTEARREQIRATAVDAVRPFGDGGYDLAAGTALFAVAVVGGIMDLPRADWPGLVSATMAAVAPADPATGRTGDPDVVLAAAHRELFGYLQDMVAHRRRHPGDDLISSLLGMEMDGRPLSPGEIVSNCYSLLLGASVTVAHVAPSTLRELMGTPGLEKWADTPQLLQPGVEEALRWSCPAAHFLRHASRDTEIGGQAVAAGDPVVVWLGSANRDPEMFADPFTFDPGRRPNKHLSFGIGPHYCVGHTVARISLRLLFAELFSRFTELTPVGPAAPLRSDIVTGWTAMPITARPRPRVRPPAY